MFYIIEMQRVFWHRYFRPGKHGRFIHVIPSIQGWSRSFIVFVIELISPKISRFATGVIDPITLSWIKFPNLASIHRRELRHPWSLQRCPTQQPF